MSLWQATVLTGANFNGTSLSGSIDTNEPKKSRKNRELRLRQYTALWCQLNQQLGSWGSFLLYQFVVSLLLDSGKRSPSQKHTVAILKYTSVLPAVTQTICSAHCLDGRLTWPYGVELLHPSIIVRAADFICLDRQQNIIQQATGSSNS